MLQPEGFAPIPDWNYKNKLSFAHTVETQGGHQVMNMNLRRFAPSSCNGLIFKLQILSNKLIIQQQTKHKHLI